MKDKFKKLKREFKELNNNITSYKHHKLVFGLISIFCLFLVVILPIYNVYSTEDTPFTQPVIRKVIGNETYGNVVKEGPYGNCSSSVKIAYILGEHPREWVAHKAISENVKENSASFKYCYYFYRINVTQYANDYAKGRMNGQFLANKYVVPDIANDNFRLAIDVHGTDGEYSKKVFLFTPIEEYSSIEIAHNLTNTLKNVPYYSPASATSPNYCTVPLIKKGVPSIVYESFKDQAYSLVKEQNKEFVFGVDKLNLTINGCC
ncbi:hypothetical protein [Methanobacterium petrolearium]|uniref:hypothetical protein n=1 Tax=Methanobacterium petrolearium TaxID=710190 RepID=UPI001AE34715|nr:hypothetical protein [Methanobacterium petrolearium]MBP1944935.1 hypothetical protein [Methanobacterium petrolearium]BDZ70250.1 hypothetical protein GCM10025861_07670 [Methanobacterium petrolearium]